MFSEFTNIIIKSIKLDKNLYKDQRYFGEAGIYFALIIVIIVSLISIIPNNAFLDYMNNNFGLGEINSPKIRTVLFTNLIFWIIKSCYLYIFGTILFPAKGNKSNFSKTLILVAYAYAPLIMNAVIIDSSLLFLTIIFYLWYSATLIVGVNQMYNYKSIPKSIILVMAPIAILIIYTIYQFLNLKVGVLS